MTLRVIRLRIPAVLALAAALPAQDIAPQVDALAGAYLKQNRFMGSILAAKGGRVLLARGYGYANLEHEVPNTPQTKFRLGSITKQFTAALILKLEEQGKLATADPVAKHYPGAPEAWKDITIHHLVTHTSGIPNYTALPDYVPKMRDKVKPEEMIARFKDRPLEFEPGSRFRYSNSGYFLLGYIIERVAGESYESFLKKTIFDPLDMQASGYDWDTTILKHRAAGYELGPDRKLRNAPYLDMGQPFSAGSLYSTVEDLYRWDRALYTEKVLTRKSLEKMFTPERDNYAYGFIVDKQFNRRRISHGGGINGFTTQIARYPDDDVCVVVLNNLGGPATGAIARDVAAIVFGEKYSLPVERQEVTLAPAVLDKYVGSYKAGPFDLTIKRDGAALTITVGGQGTVPLFAEAPGKFFIRAADAQFLFNEDASEITMIQGDLTIKGKRAP
jgi:CubicO group peptidase (beta-lactamase class C family)